MCFPLTFAPAFHGCWLCDAVERIKVMWPRERLIERSLSTDDLETFFGSVVVHCQYKPRLVSLSGVQAMHLSASMHACMHACITVHMYMHAQGCMGTKVGCATSSTARSCAAQHGSSSASASRRPAHPSMHRACIVQNKCNLCMHKHTDLFCPLPSLATWHLAFVRSGGRTGPSCRRPCSAAAGA